MALICDPFRGCPWPGGVSCPYLVTLSKRRIERGRGAGIVVNSSGDMSARVCQGPLRKLLFFRRSQAPDLRATIRRRRGCITGSPKNTRCFVRRFASFPKRKFVPRSGSWTRKRSSIGTSWRRWPSWVFSASASPSATAVWEWITFLWASFPKCWNGETRLSVRRWPSMSP